MSYTIKDSRKQLADLDLYLSEISSINIIKLTFKFQYIIIGLTIIGLILALANAESIIDFVKHVIKRLSG